MWTACTGALIQIVVEALTIDIRTDMEIGALADELTNVFASELVDVGIDRPAGVRVVVASAVIALELVVSTEVSTSCAIDVLVDALTGEIVPASDICVDMLTDVDATLLVTTFTFIVPALLTDSVPFC